MSVVSILRSPFVQALLLLALLRLVASCGDEISVDNGLSAKLRVSNAQYEDKHFPVDVDSDASVPVQTLADGGAVPVAPGVLSIDSQNNSVKRGTVNKSLRLVVDQGATTVAVALEGDRGYWVAPVTVRSVEFSPALELTATLEFDRTLAVGATRLFIAAANASGHYGAVRALDLNILDDAPIAPLVVALDWTQNVDLDLVVKLPDGSTLTNKATKTSSAADAPKIDIDSNANCVLDGHRAENAVFTAVLAGTYTVYVRQAASCGFPETGWRVRLLRDGKVISTVNGASYAYEVGLPNGGPSGPGRQALRFDIGG